MDARTPTPTSISTSKGLTSEPSSLQQTDLSKWFGTNPAVSRLQDTTPIPIHFKSSCLEAVSTPRPNKMATATGSEEGVELSDSADDLPHTPSNEDISRRPSHDSNMGSVSSSITIPASQLPNAHRPGLTENNSSEQMPRRNPQRSAAIHTNYSLLDPFVNLESLRRDKITGDFTARRKSGQLATLRCSACDRDTYHTLNGLRTHMAVLHRIRFHNYQEVAEYCSSPKGVVVAEEATSETADKVQESKAPPKPALASSLPSPRRSSRSSASPQPKRQRLCEVTAASSPQKSTSTEAEAVLEQEERSQEASFHFIKVESTTGVSRTTRVRPVKVIDTVEKFCVHAFVAGITTKETSLLAVSVNGGKPRYVVRGDREDFESVLADIRVANRSNEVVVATVRTEELFF